MAVGNSHKVSTPRFVSQCPRAQIKAVKAPCVPTCFAVVRLGCWAVLFAVFSKISEVVLIYSKYHLQIWLKLLIRTTESCVVVCFVGNIRGNSSRQRCRVVICQLSCIWQEIQVLSAYKVGRLVQYIPFVGFLSMSLVGGQATNKTNKCQLFGWAAFGANAYMPKVRGQVNTTQPSHVAAGWSLSQLTIVCGRNKRKP